MLTGPDSRRPGTDGANLADRPAVRYFGIRTPSGVTVASEDAAGGVRPLALRLDLRRHSPMSHP